MAIVFSCFRWLPHHLQLSFLLLLVPLLSFALASFSKLWSAFLFDWRINNRIHLSRKVWLSILAGHLSTYLHKRLRYPSSRRGSLPLPPLPPGSDRQHCHARILKSKLQWDEQACLGSDIVTILSPGTYNHALVSWCRRVSPQVVLCVVYDLVLDTRVIKIWDVTQSNPDPSKRNQGTCLLSICPRRRCALCTDQISQLHLLCLRAGTPDLPPQHLPNKKRKKKWRREKIGWGPDQTRVEWTWSICFAWPAKHSSHSACFDKCPLSYQLLWQSKTLGSNFYFFFDWRGGIMRHEQFGGTLVWPAASRPA